MTRISLLKASDGRLIGYDVSGHTMYATAGKDIVCAALSFLSITCANALESVAGVKPDITVEEETGRLKVLLKENQLTQTASTILQVFNQGIRDLQATYPKHIFIL